jgi:hypothetical protein
MCTMPLPTVSASRLLNPQTLFSSISRRESVWVYVRGCNQVAERALQAARHDACVIAESLDERERSISSSEEAWPVLLSTLDALERRMQLLHEFSSRLE